MARSDIAREIVHFVGAPASLQDAGTGWPSLVDVRTAQGFQRVALHVSRASPHSREEWEWRFQNPGNREPVSHPVGTFPLLVGLDHIIHQPVLIVVDGRSRVGREARFSILYNKRIAREAARNGWSQQTSGTGEEIYAIRPRFLPSLIELMNAGVQIPVGSITTAAFASGFLGNDAEDVAERARRTVSAYVRHAGFSRAVKDAYEHRCAMCRVGLGLVAGAHIKPVSAPSAPDRVWNGLALCHNHHSAFDAHNLWIAADYTIRISPALATAARVEEESANFLERTRSELWTPPYAPNKPRREMLEQRYAYYEDRYDWAPAF